MSAPRGATATAKPTTKENSKNLALYMTAQHLNKWERTRSIIWMMHTNLTLALAEAEAGQQDISKMENANAQAEEFMLNVDWLADLLDEDASSLRGDLKEAGYTS